MLEGFALGTGMLSGVLSKGDTDRQVLLLTIGPVWNGNEVWLVTAGGATFA
jgi:cytochrome d ubiquinol oxidase subunit II